MHPLLKAKVIDLAAQITQNVKPNGDSSIDKLIAMLCVSGGSLAVDMDGENTETILRNLLGYILTWMRSNNMVDSILINDDKCQNVKTNCLN